MHPGHLYLLSAVCARQTPAVKASRPGRGVRLPHTHWLAAATARLRAAKCPQALQQRRRQARRWRLLPKGGRWQLCCGACGGTWQHWHDRPWGAADGRSRVWTECSQPRSCWRTGVWLGCGWRSTAVPAAAMGSTVEMLPSLCVQLPLQLASQRLVAGDVGVGLRWSCGGGVLLRRTAQRLSGPAHPPTFTSTARL